MSHGEPISYLTLQSGTDVISADGERVGVVERVLHDERTNVFDGIVIDTRLGPGGLRFVDAPEVADVRENAVLLAVSAADLERLPKPEAGPAVLDHHGIEDSEGPVRRRLRRAWEIISGRG